MKLANRIVTSASSALTTVKAKALTGYAAVALAVGALTLGITGHASAQYVPTNPSVDNLFDFTALGVTVLTTLGAAMAIVAGVAITIAIGIMIVRKLKTGKV